MRGNNQSCHIADATVQYIHIKMCCVHQTLLDVQGICMPMCFSILHLGIVDRSLYKGIC